MRFAAPMVAIASMAGLVAGQTKIMQIEDGQIQGPALSACAHPWATPPAPYPAAPYPAVPAMPSAAYPAAPVVPHTPPKIQVHRPTPSATTAPYHPMIFEGGALARQYPIGGAMALCAVAIALAMA